MNSRGGIFAERLFSETMPLGGIFAEHPILQGTDPGGGTKISSFQ